MEQPTKQPRGVPDWITLYDDGKYVAIFNYVENIVLTYIWDKTAKLPIIYRKKKNDPPTNP